MGFWHTGYMEFHEPVGLDGYVFDPLPPRFACGQCEEVFSSIEALRTHRFERHPLLRPLLLLHGRELGSHPARITSPLKQNDIYVDRCDRAVLNGRNVPPSLLPGELARMSSDICRLTLSSGEVSSDFTLDFRIASEEDLLGVESEFERIALGRRLDTRAIEDFIAATSGYASALGYCDGICAYLYGVLVKERAPDSSLPQEGYVGKYSKAAEELADYDRRLARTIGSLIEFHFNHFGEAIRLAGGARIGTAAARFLAWMRGRRPAEPRVSTALEAMSQLEVLVTDWETEQIVRWVIRPLRELSRHVEDMETFLCRDIAEYDRVKMHVLLAETYSYQGESQSALNHAKALRNLSAFEAWAEAKIRAHPGDQNEHH